MKKVVLLFFIPLIIISQNEQKLIFDGIDDYVEIPSSDTFDNMIDEITISSWIKINEDWSEEGTVVARRNFLGNPMGERHHFQLYITPERSLAFSTQNNQNNELYTAQLTSGTGQVNTDCWHYITATFKNGLVRLYVDGILISENDFGYREMFPINHWVNFGRVHRTGGTPFFSEFNGEVFNIEIWQEELTIEDIQYNMYTYPTGNESNLVGYWDFNNGQAQDLTPNNNNGVIYGAGSLSTAIPQICQPGCLDPTACNYNLEATEDDGTCYFSTDCVDCLGNDLCDIEQNLVAWYPFCGNTNDESGNEKHGTINNPNQISLSEDRFNNINSAYYFNGTSISLPEISEQIGAAGSSTTLSLWFKSEGNNNNSTLFHNRSMSSPCGSQDTDYLRIEETTPNNMFVYFRTGDDIGDGCQEYNVSAANGITNTPFITNEWNHLTVVINGQEGTYKLYLNGQEDEVVSYNFNPEIDFYSSDRQWDIGGIGFQNTNWFTGHIDDVGLWERALSENEILNLYNNNPIQVCAVSGCTDITACNYNENATDDDGSCEFIEQVSISGETETCEESVLLESIGGPYESYQWYLDGDVINNENQATILASQSGTYKIEATNSSLENNYSLLFDGQNDYIEIQNVSINHGNTISFWAKSDQPQTWGNVISAGQLNTPNGEFAIAFTNAYNDEFGLYLTIGNGVGYVPLTENTNWNHFVITFPNTPTMISDVIVYQNGIPGPQMELVFSNAELNTEEVTEIDNELMVLGQNICSNNPDYFNGNLDQLSIWSTVLNQNQIESLYNCPPTGNEEGLLNHWAIEDQSLAILFDSKNNTYNGEFINMNTNDSWDSESPTQNCNTNCLSSAEINITINNCGCIDPNADNFDATANVDDGNCEYLGCTDPTACNYNLIATINDGSCEYLDVNLGEDVTTCEGLVTLNAGEGFNTYEWSTGETTQTIDVTETGSYSVSVNNFGENNNFEIGSLYEGGVIFYIENNTAYIVTENILASGVSCDGNGVNTPWGCNGQLVGASGEGLGDGYQNTLNIINSGCADSTSPAFICYNYNNGFDDWYLPSIGELDLIYQNLFLTNSMNYDTCDPNNWYRSSTECNENSVKDFNFSGGNEGMGMDNCNSKSDWQGGVLAIRSVDLFNPITCSDSDDIFVTINNCGCTNPVADNFDATANVDDGSCEHLGCTDSSADNFDATANVDDGSCEYLGCTDDTACNYDSVANTDNGTCDYTTCAGCTELGADNYSPIATIDDGSCEYLGCTDSLADNFDSTANVDDGSCEYWGCTDSLADNFDATANVDDGTCEYLGCTDPNACNFNPTANTDDGSCQLCASREFNDGAYLDVDSEIINAQGITISFWVNDSDFCANPEDFATYIDFGSQDTYRYVVRNRSCKIEAFFEGEMLPTEFDWGTFDWGYPKASAAGGIGPQSGWRQITTVFCPTTIRIYVDGNIVASNGTGVYFQEGFNLFADDIKRIGSNQVDYEPANAMIDEVKIWNRALSGEEVLARAGGATTLNMDEELNLNGYWQMDCANPFLNQVTGQLGVNNLSVVNENFNNNSCEETDNNYDYTCPVDLTGFADCNSCDPPEGCTDEEACNYDYLAVISIPSACFYIADYCPDLEYPEYYDCDCKCINDSDSDDVCDELELDGCSEDENACNYNPEGTEPCIYPEDEFGVAYVDCEGNCLDDIDGDGVCDEVDNCVDIYNPNQEDLNDDGIGDDCDGVGLEELGDIKKIIKVTDVLGREIQKETKGSTLMYWYNTGEVEIKYIF